MSLDLVFSKVVLWPAMSSFWLWLRVQTKAIEENQVYCSFEGSFIYYLSIFKWMCMLCARLDELQDRFKSVFGVE